MRGRLSADLIRLQATGTIIREQQVQIDDLRADLARVTEERNRAQREWDVLWSQAGELQAIIRRQAQEIAALRQIEKAARTSCGCGECQQGLSAALARLDAAPAEAQG